MITEIQNTQPPEVAQDNAWQRTEIKASLAET